MALPIYQLWEDNYMAFFVFAIILISILAIAGLSSTIDIKNKHIKELQNLIDILRSPPNPNKTLG